MKKFISLLLVCVLMLGFITPAFAASNFMRSQYPIIYFRGNGEDIYDEDGNVVYDFDVDKETITEMAERILPYFAKGMLTNDFDEYYQVFGDEVASLFETVMLDGNGDAQYGTGISQEHKQSNDYEKTHNLAKNGTYYLKAYAYSNDWRLDPMDTVDDLNDFIDGVLKSTGKSKVCLAAVCLGGDLILAYISKYGTSKIHAICFGSSVSFGGGVADDVYTGDIVVNSDTLTRYVNDRDVASKFSSEQQFLYSFITETLDLAAATGITQGVTDAAMTQIYDRLYEGLVPALVIATYGTWAGYWTTISADNYEKARDFVFGDETSERYQYYSGLIKKLDYYYENVSSKIPELLKQAEADGVNIGIVAKYGYQITPIIKSADEQGDSWVALKNASLGATASKIGTTLSDEYIASQTEAGYGKYISPDNQVDASTCLFPEYTWFIKGAIHNDWINEEIDIMARVCDCEEQITVDTLSGYSQFMVYNSETDTLSTMTTENCNTESYEVDNNTEQSSNKSISLLTKLIKWITSIINLLSNLFEK